MENVFWSPGMSLEEMEKLVILAAFRFNRGNKTATANSLGVAIRTLDNKLEKYEKDGLARKESEQREREAANNYLMRARGIPQPIEGTTPEDVALHKEKLGIRPVTGVRVEPASKDTAKQQMPVSKR